MHFTVGFQLALEEEATTTVVALVHVSRYALESPVSPADLIALSPGYRVPPDLATIPYVRRHMRFALTEAEMSFRMFETMLPAP